MATTQLYSIPLISRHEQDPAERRPFTSKKFSPIQSRCPIARSEPAPTFIQVPVFQTETTCVDDYPELVESVLQGVAGIIRREIRTLQDQSVARSSTAITLDRAMIMLGCKRSKIFDLLKQGILKRAQKVGRSVMITMDSVEALLAADLPQKGGKRSCRPECRRDASNTPKQAHKHEKFGMCAVQDPGAAIRKLAL